MEKTEDLAVKKHRARRYVKVPRRSRLPLILAWSIVAVCFVASVWGVATIDRNSCAIGWDTHHTEFAVVRQPGRIIVTVFGRSASVEFHPAKPIVKAFEVVGRAVKDARPATLRLAQMVSTRVNELFVRLVRLTGQSRDAAG